LRRLLIRPGAIGDFILSLPAMEHLRTDYLEVWTASANLPLARFADKTDSIAGSGLDLMGLPGQKPPARLIERLRSFDSIISWYGSNREEFRQAAAELGLPFQFLPALPVVGQTIDFGRLSPDLGPPPTHAADFYLRQVGGSGPAIPCIECAVSPAAGQCAVIHPFSGSAKKNWPLERFRTLAKQMALPVEWCAGPEEELEGAVRIANLYELACWLASARIYIGNDSGITHLAAAVGIPVVALFGPTDPAIWAPRGPQVRIVRGETMESIATEQVAEAVRSQTPPST
jgi:ADP-heptose:LPS heptosyltransferase